MSSKVGGVICMCGYLPLAKRIVELRNERQIGESRKKWLLAHGSKDMLVPTRLFEQEKQELAKWTKPENVEDHVYQGMGHSSSPAQLRDMLIWLEKILPA